MYNTKANPNVNLKSLDPTLHLTVSERDEIAKIRSKALFLKGEEGEVDANYLVSLLHPELSAQDNPHRAAEHQVLVNFQDFIYSLEDEKVSGIMPSVECNDDDDDDDEGNGEIKYEHASLTPAGVMQ